MAQDNLGERQPGLASVAIRYPEKTSFLGQVFGDTTNSYKFVWFLALLSLLDRTKQRSFRLSDVFIEMAVFAWHPVCLFRLSLGSQDKLQDKVRELQASSELPPAAGSEDVRHFLENSELAQTKLRYLKRYVPMRFLTPWFQKELDGVPDGHRDARTKSMARDSQQRSIACPYYFEGSGKGECIKVNESWREFFSENVVVVRSFVEHHFSLYLQARNPYVPGVINKLYAPPTERENLEDKREFWRLVRNDLVKKGRDAEFCDIYSQRPLGDSFDMDHFLPWSFVAHDLLWNLAPVEQTTNSSKSDRLPDLDRYLPRLAKLHFTAIGIVAEQPTLPVKQSKLLDDYADCFKQDVPHLLKLGEEEFAAKYEEIIRPQAQIARNQGFRDWRFKG